MKPKAILKITVDILMTIGLLLLMGYQFWGDVFHEWAGTVMFLLFILHHLLNIGWYKTLFCGKYSSFRIFQTVIDAMVLLAMLGLMISGIMLSNHVFAFLKLSGKLSFARLLHMTSSYWGFVLMSLHIGLHWGLALGMAKKAMKKSKLPREGKILLFVVGAGVAVYGLIAFIKRNLLTYMLLQTQFVFLDFSESPLLFYLDYLAMMGTFSFLARYTAKLLRRLSWKRSKRGTK